MFHIQKATGGDAELIADLSRATFFETFAGSNTKEDMELFLGTQFTREQLMLEVQAEPGLFALLYDGTTPAGYLRLRTDKTPPELAGINALEIARIYVLQEWQGKAAGSLLMKYAHAFATEHHYELIWLGVWEKNVKALQFYKKWGFEHFGAHDFLLGNDVQCDLLLKKQLIQ